MLSLIVLPVWMQQPLLHPSALRATKMLRLSLQTWNPCLPLQWRQTTYCEGVGRERNVRREQDRWMAASIPAIPPGIQGLVVIDCDRKPGQADGVQAFHQLCQQNSVDLSSTLAVDTPTNGRHYYFTTAIAYGNAHSFPAGIDVRGAGDMSSPLAQPCRMDAATGSFQAPGGRLPRFPLRWQRSFASDSP